MSPSASKTYNSAVFVHSCVNHIIFVFKNRDKIFGVGSMCGDSHFTNILFEAHIKRKPSYSLVKHSSAKNQDLTPNLDGTNDSRTERRYLALRRSVS